MSGEGGAVSVAVRNHTMWFAGRDTAGELRPGARRRGAVGQASDLRRCGTRETPRTDLTAADGLCSVALRLAGSDGTQGLQHHRRDRAAGTGRSHPDQPFEDAVTAPSEGVGWSETERPTDLTVPAPPGKLGRVAPAPAERLVTVRARSLRTQQCAKSRRRIN